VLNQGGFGGRRSGPLKVVAAPDPALYDYWREGEGFSYAIPLANGQWTVTVHSFEPRDAVIYSQTMTVAAQGSLVVPAFNPGKAAGGALKAIAKTFRVTVTDGMVKLDFAGQGGGKAVVAAIEISK
jgi:beta-galactosidase